LEAREPPFTGNIEGGFEKCFIKPILLEVGYEKEALFVCVYVSVYFWTDFIHADRSDG
jgi:hypothetical protein